MLESNILLVPYLAFLGLYVVNTTKSYSNEKAALKGFMDLSTDKWVESACEPEGPLYFTAMALLVAPPSEWASNRVSILRRLLLTGQARTIGVSKILTDRSIKEYSIYKPYLLYFSLIDGLYKKVFDKVEVKSGEEWSFGLAEFIRRSDAALSETSATLLDWFEREVQVCESFAEWLDVMGKLY